MYYLIQPWQSNQRHKFEHGGQTVSRHPSVVDAYTELDRVGDRLRTFGLAPDTIELYVVDEGNHLVPRPGTHRSGGDGWHVSAPFRHGTARRS